MLMTQEIVNMNITKKIGGSTSMPNYVPIYWARKTGNTVEEETERYFMRTIPRNESTFRISSYERYLDNKANFRLRGEF